MTQFVGSNDSVAIENSVLDVGVPLESILRTEELYRRPCRAPSHEKENRALVALASALASDSSHTILQTLAETILQVTESDSSGVSLLTTDDGGKRFYWPAIAGIWKPHMGGGTPRNFGPCGDVLDRNCSLLFQHFERRYSYLLPVMPPAEECLLVPFYVQGKAVGTIWAIMHDDHRKFDAEDERLMKVLGQFASLAYQTLASIDDLKFQVAARKKAEAELLALTNGLETQVRVRTQKLEQRNRQLAETKARLIEEKLSLKRNEAYLAGAQKLSHTGSWHWNIATQEVFLSQELLAIFGFDSEKDRASYSLFFNRIHPEDRSRVDALWQAAIRDRNDFEDEYRVLLPGGSIKYVHSIGQCLVNQSGDVEYIGAVMDITERKRSEDELRRSEQRFRAMLDNSPNLIFLKDTQGRYLLVNREFEKAFQVTQKQIAGKRDDEIFPLEQAAAFQSNDAKVLQSRIPMEFEEVATYSDGQHISIVQKFPLFDSAGTIYATGSIATDITDRKRMVETLRQSEEQYRIVAETAVDAIVNIGEDGKIHYANPATATIFGHECAALIGQPITKLMPECFREAHTRGMQRYLETGRRQLNWKATQFNGLRKNGQEFPIEVSFAELNKDGRRAFIGFIRDITDRKQAEDALRSSEGELRKIVAQLALERARLVEAQGVAKMGSWDADLKNMDVSWSEQTHRIFETDPSHFHPTRPKFFEFIHPEDRAKVEAAFKASLEKRSPSTVEYRIVMPDRRVKFLEEQWQAFHNKEGNPIRVAGTCRDVTERVQAEDELKRLSAKLLCLQDEERRRIARDLHDSTGQDLVAVATMLGQLRRLVPSAERKSRRLVSECKALAETCIRQLRTLSYVLHPPLLEQGGLGEAIRDYVKRFTQRSGIHVELEVPSGVGRLAQNVELALFRVVQEALTNIQRHSGSQHAKIRISNHPDDLIVEISDRGDGVKTGLPKLAGKLHFETGVGILSMRERVKSIGGQLHIETTNDGTTVQVTLPSEDERHEEASHSDS